MNEPFKGVVTSLTSTRSRPSSTQFFSKYLNKRFQFPIWMQWFKVETSLLELLWEFHHPHKMQNVMTVSISYHLINVTQDDVRWCNLSIQVIHITLPKENLDASGWTATAFSNKSSIIGGHMSNNLVNHFDLQQLETWCVGLHML